MPPARSGRSSRANLRDLRSQMAAKIGPDRAQRYFRHLGRFLVQKLRKPEFEALCVETLGLENVGLHNSLLRSILYNASRAKLPAKKAPSGPSPLPRRSSSQEHDRRPIEAPLGIQQSAIRASSSFFSGDGELGDSEALRNRMERIASGEGLAGVTMDCANLLNNGVDAYLKRLVASCVGLANARSFSNHHLSVLDLAVAIEANPQLLGHRWPLLLEKSRLQFSEN
ncbi:uncharacterized protein LOC144705603 [Wolffia australiana]